jgi:hypothetical protein
VQLACQVIGDAEPARRIAGRVAQRQQRLLRFRVWANVLVVTIRLLGHMQDTFHCCGGREKGLVACLVLLLATCPRIVVLAAFPLKFALLNQADHRLHVRPDRGQPALADFKVVEVAAVLQIRNYQIRLSDVARFDPVHGRLVFVRRPLVVGAAAAEIFADFERAKHLVDNTARLPAAVRV